MAAARSILILTGSFSLDGRRPWLIDDLAHSLTSMGCEVDILLSDMHVARRRGPVRSTDENLRVFSVGPTRLVKHRSLRPLAYVIGGMLLHVAGYRMVRRNRYDLCIFGGIGIRWAGLPWRIRRKRIASRVLFVLWDFFPIHHHQIGRLHAGPLYGVLHGLEGWAIGSADVVGVMSQANECFLRSYHPRVRCKLLMLPPWSSDLPIEPEARRGDAEFTAVFGGQLVQGRGVDVLLAAAEILKDCGVPVRVVIIGDGSERDSLIRLAQRKGLAEVTFIKRVARPDYRDLIRRAHVGVAITVANAGVPSFPSKIVDYCQAGLAVITCLESESDAGSLIERAGAGCALPAGDPVKLAAALALLREEWERGELVRRGEAARRLYIEEFSADKAARRVLGMLEETPS